MKSFPQVLIAICVVLSVASAADLGSRAVAASSSMKTQVQTQTRRLEDGKPWDSGTRVYNEFPNEGWWSGTITSFSAATGMYTVTWEDGSTDYYDDGDQINQMVAYAQNDPQNNPAGAESVAGAYSTGTAVSMFEEGVWYDGVVVQYGSDTYTVKWNEGDEVEQVQAGPIMDQMVQDAIGDDDAPPAGYDGGPTPSSDSIALGTPVSYYGDGQWTDGQISQYTDGVYTVVWEDGENDQYDDSGQDFQELKQAVSDANGDDDAAPSFSSYADSSGPKFAVGTPVSDWEDGTWVDGQVVDFQDGKYIVQWSDEDQVEYYDSANAEEMQELTKMTGDADGDDDTPPASFFDSEDLWEIGTPVAVNEDDVVWYGKIDGFRQGEYSIAWDNGESEYLDNFDLVNQMVSNAAVSPKRKSGMGGVGKFFLSLFIISVCVVGSVFGYKFYEKRQAEQKRELDLAVQDGSEASYRDQPDNLPKII